MKAVTILVGFVMISSIITVNQAFTQESENTQVENKMFTSSFNPSYINSLYGFSINVPKNWLVQENSELIGGAESSIVGFYSDRSNPKYTANFFIMYQNLTPEYLNLLKLYSQEELLDQFSSAFLTSNTKILNKNIKVYSDGYKITLEYVQTTKITEKDFSTLQRETVLFILQNGDMYSLQYASLPEDFDSTITKFRNSVDTFYVGRSETVQAISGKYVNDDLGFEFVIPSGWLGIQSSSSEPLLLLPTTYQKMTSGLPEFVISVYVTEESEHSETTELSDSENDDCTLDVSYKLINKIPLREANSICSDQAVKGYKFAQDGKIVTIAYLSKIPVDKEKENDFEKLVSTLKIDNPLPIKDIWRQLNDFQTYNKKILIGDSELQIKYYSTSEVDEFTVDSQKKQIILKVNELGNFGSTIIPISKFLQKPYSIVIDGNKNEVVLTEDKIEGITEISADYEKGTHVIAISGKDLITQNIVSQPSNNKGQPICGPGTIEKDGICVVAKEPKPKSSGGCLIATAAFGSELAPQVQFLREIRDNTVLSTASGASFMTAFNAFYYSFSPTVADLERQNPVFKETVKVAITPLLSSLSLLQYVNIDSEAEMLGYGIEIILLNIGMYFVLPAILIIKIRKRYYNTQIQIL